MKRCAICDYTSETRTDFTGAKLEYRKLHYNKKFDEYQCEACASSLKDSKLQYWYHDVKEGKEKVDDFVRYKERIYDVQPGMLLNLSRKLNVEDTVFEIPTSLPPLLLK
jgi:hypothetical protein